MAEYLIAPPGTPADSPDWHTPPSGTQLTWTIEGIVPNVAVKRDGVLISTGMPIDAVMGMLTGAPEN